MTTSQTYVVEELTQPVTIVDVLPPTLPSKPAVYTNKFLTLESLTKHFNAADYQESACRIILIHQRNSWRPLQVTQSMLDAIATEHDVGPSFWSLPSCFYSRNLDLEESFCVPYTFTTMDNTHEVLYTIRYPEFKENENKWVIRQSGVYHQYNSKTFKSLFVVFSPTANSKIHEVISDYLVSGAQRSLVNHLWLHDLLLSTHLPAWRHYIAAQEEKLLPIANSTFAVFIDEPLRIGFDTLGALIHLESRLLQCSAILSHSSDLLSDLNTFVELVKGNSNNNTKEIAMLKVRFDNQLRHCRSYSHTTAYLQKRTRAAAELLSDTLSYRDQVVGTEQNKSMIKLNKSAVFITALTLMYLPSSFVATFFGMNFFAMNQEDHHIIGSSMIWIYVVASVALTVITMVLYYRLLKRDSTLSTWLQPRASVLQERKQTSLEKFVRHLLRSQGANKKSQELPF